MCEGIEEAISNLIVILRNFKITNTTPKVACYIPDSDVIYEVTSATILHVGRLF